MKVILNKDLAPLGEEGDVKEVAKGYARNFLFPRKIAVPYNDSTVRAFEARKEEIEGRKAQKRLDAAGIKERLEALSLELTMPAGPNGKLYGAVTSQTLADELAKHGFQIERKRIELAGNSFKSVGKYKAIIKLYESASAEIAVTVTGQEVKTETPAPAKSRRPFRKGAEGGAGGASKGEAAPETSSESAAPEAAPETPAEAEVTAAPANEEQAE